MMKIDNSGYYLALSLLLGFLFVSESYAFFLNAKITVKVVNENGSPLEGANVGIGFEKNTGWGTKMSGKQGLSYKEGVFSTSGYCNGHISYGADMEGYYDSYNTYDFVQNNSITWKPWNPDLEVVLRKIENPVPMYARDTKKSMIEIPVVNEAVGFDLTKFDWVAPYGNGINADFIFHLKRHVIDRKDFDATLTITFSNDFDGIQLYREELKGGSLFKLLRHAPENGYLDKIVLREWRNPDDYNVKRNIDFLASDINYFFRVRSDVVDGKIEQAMYGKILGVIDFTAVHSETAKIYFKYYLNPDYTRNLEFDPDQNLFKNLPDREQVGIK